MKKFLILLLLFCIIPAYADIYTHKEILDEIEKNGPSVQGYFELGKAYLYEKDYLRAINAFDYTLNYETDDPEIYNYLGICYYRRRNFNKALENFKKAVSLNNENLIYINNLALCYKSLGDRENYEKTIGKIAAYIPKTQEDYVQITQILYDRKDYERARAILMQGMKKYPDNPILNKLFTVLNKL